MSVELDYAQLEAAAKAGDFEKVSITLGVEVESATWALFETWCSGTHDRYFTPAVILAVVRRALISESGFAYERFSRDRHMTTHVLAVRSRDVVVLGFKSRWATKKIIEAWPSLAGWKTKLENNVALVNAWSKLPPEDPPDRVQLKIRGDFRVADDGDEEQKFLDAISRAPDDDDLRRVYADWLDERGDARGEFIRLQLSEAAKPYGEGRERMLDMLKSSWRNFAGELAPWCNEHCFARGLVARVNMTPAAFVKEGERVFSKYPLQTLYVHAPKFTDKQLLQVANAPAISRVRTVALAQLNPRAMPRLPMAALAKGTHFDSLRSLHFMSCGHSGEDWSELFMRIDAPKLEELEFSFNHTHPAMWLAMATSPGLKNLKSIDEYVVSMLGGDEGDFAKALREMADQRPRLEKLILSQVDHFDDAGLAPLFAKSSVVNLRELDINGAKLTDETLRNWVRGGRLGEMKSLTVRNALFTVKGIEAFLEALPPKLELLSLICFDKALWTVETVGALYEALLRVPTSSSLKRVAVPYAPNQEDPKWLALKERFEVER